MDGGFNNWRRQEIDEHRGPPGRYGHLRELLSDLPDDKYWVFDKTNKEWRLEPKAKGEIVATATFVEEFTQRVDDKEKEENDHRRPRLHNVQYTDTFESICLKYKITPMELRQANCWFSGTDLLLAPNPLVIPAVTEPYVEAEVIASSESCSSANVLQETPEEQASKLRRFCIRMSKSESKCYLELNDWNFEKALSNARDDGF